MEHQRDARSRPRLPRRRQTGKLRSQELQTRFGLVGLSDAPVRPGQVRNTRMRWQQRRRAILINHCALLVMHRSRAQCNSVADVAEDGMIYRKCKQSLVPQQAQRWSLQLEPVSRQQRATQHQVLRELRHSRQPQLRGVRLQCRRLCIGHLCHCRQRRRQLGHHTLSRCCLRAHSLAPSRLTGHTRGAYAAAVCQSQGFVHHHHSVDAKLHLLSRKAGLAWL